MSDKRINSRKKVIENQTYEDHWKLSLGTSDFFGDQFRRTLALILKHIEKYKLDQLTQEEKIINLDAKKKDFIDEVVHYDELKKNIRKIYPNDDKTGATTRKQINQYIKLGFIKPYFNGYAPLAYEYVKHGKTINELRRMFSDTVYEYASFNSSATNDYSDYNQVKFIVQTLLHRKSKRLTSDEIIGLSLLDKPSKVYATEREITVNSNWAKATDFESRKYNQIRYIRNVFDKLYFFETRGTNRDYTLFLSKDAKEFLPENPDTQRDNYRFSVMKKAVHEESREIYGDVVDWLTKEKQMGLVVSHIYPSAEALAKYKVDIAYDPNNALLLSPGDNDQYFDKHYITFDNSGNVLFGNDVRKDFIEKIKDNNYKLDKAVLNEKRVEYLVYHNEKFNDKNEK